MINISNIANSKLLKKHNSEIVWLEEKIKETRVKNFNNYRLKIRKEFEDLKRNKDENKKLDLFEKKIEKINPNLLIDQAQQNNIFVNNIASTTNDYSYIDEAATILTKLESKKLSEIVYKHNIEKDIFQKDPSFDNAGQLSLEWLKEDAKFKYLKDMQKWNLSMIHNRLKIVDFLKYRVSLFKKTLEMCNKPKERESILIPKSEKLNVYKNTKLKVIFRILFSSFCLVLISIIILIIILFVGV